MPTISNFSHNVNRFFDFFLNKFKTVPKDLPFVSYLRKGATRKQRTGGKQTAEAQRRRERTKGKNRGRSKMAI